MRSSKDMHSHMLHALNCEYDRQCDAARVVLNKFITENSDEDVAALIMMNSYANVMFRFIWTDANTFGRRIFTSPLKFAIDACDLDLVLRLRKLADNANKLEMFEQQFAEHAKPVFFKRYRTTLTPEEKTINYREVLDTTPKSIVGNYPKLREQRTYKAKSVSTTHMFKLAKLIHTHEEQHVPLKTRH